MFTGLIEDIGKVVRAASGTLVIETRLDGIHVGDSVAVNGICLTVGSIVQHGSVTRPMFAFSPETAAVTTIGRLHAGSAVNIERALRADGRIGGHVMTGHIEGTSRLRKRQREGNSEIFTFSPVRALRRYIVAKGSIGIDGISLTVVESRDAFFSVSVVPYTLKHTNLREMVIGQQANIEPDLLAKYAASVLTAGGPGAPVTEEFLRRNGFLE